MGEKQAKLNEFAVFWPRLFNGAADGLKWRLIQKKLVEDFAHSPMLVGHAGPLEPQNHYAKFSFCLRRSQPQAYKLLFSIIIASKVKKLKELTNNLKNWQYTKLIGS